MSLTKIINEGVKERGLVILNQSKSNLRSMGVRNTGALIRSAKTTVKYSFGEAELIQFRMHRYGFIQATEGGLGSKASMQNGKRRLTGGTARPALQQAIDDNLKGFADWLVKIHANEAVDMVKLGLKVKT